MTWNFDLENQSWEKVWSYKKHEHYQKVLYVSCSFPTLTTQGYTYVSWSIQTPQQTHTHTYRPIYIFPFMSYEHKHFRATVDRLTHKHT